MRSFNGTTWLRVLKSQNIKCRKIKLKKTSLRTILLSAISIIIILAFVYYLYDNIDRYRELLKISPTGVIIIFMLSLAFPLLNGLQNTFLYRSLGANITHQEGFWLTAVSTLANQLPISGGVVSKGVYLKYKYNLSYTRFVSSTFALFFCYIAVNGAIGVITLLYLTLFKKTVVSLVLWSAFATMFFCFLIFWLPLDHIKIPKRFHELFQRAVEGWVLISKNFILLLQLVVLQSILLVLLALRYWVAFHMLSQNVSIGQTLLFASASILTQLVSIAPGGLGVREAIVGATAAILGFNAGTSVVAVGLDRLISTLVIVLTGGIGVRILGMQTATIVSNRNELL